MGPPSFAHDYRELVKGLRRCGMPTPWIAQRSPLHLLYDIFLVAVICFTLFTYIYTIVMRTWTFEELCVLIHGIFLFLGVLSLTVYHKLYRHRLKQLTDDLDLTAQQIFESQLGQEEPFLKLYSNSSQFIGSLSKGVPLFQTCCAFLYLLSVPVVDWASGAYRTRHPLPINAPFNDKLPGVYELMVLVVGGTLSICCCKKGLNDCLFLSLFKISTIYLQYLSMAMDALKKELLISDNVIIRRKLLLWIKLHQDINRNIRRLLEIFSPIVVIYYVYTIGFLVTAAFVQLKKENDNIIQSSGAGGSAAVMLVQMFMLSNTAGKLTNEAQKLAYIAYDTPWYLMNKNNRNMVRMVLTICNKPIHVTAYRASAFLINRETFAGMMLSALSGFVTLCQMKDHFG